MYDTERHEITQQIREQAAAIVVLSSGEPDIPEPQHLGDLDSFSIVQLILSLEDYFLVPLLEEIHTFEGRTFEDLAEFVVVRIARREDEVIDHAEEQVPAT
jgi:acyl carrier protein